MIFPFLNVPFLGTRWSFFLGVVLGWPNITSGWKRALLVAFSANQVKMDPHAATWSKGMTFWLVKLHETVRLNYIYIYIYCTLWEIGRYVRNVWEISCFVSSETGGYVGFHFSDVGNARSFLTANCRMMWHVLFFNQNACKFRGYFTVSLSIFDMVGHAEFKASPAKDDFPFDDWRA